MRYKTPQPPSEDNIYAKEPLVSVILPKDNKKPNIVSPGKREQAPRAPEAAMEMPLEPEPAPSWTPEEETALAHSVTEAGEIKKTLDQANSEIERITKIEILNRSLKEKAGVSPEQKNSAQERADSLQLLKDKVRDVLKKTTVPGLRIDEAKFIEAKPDKDNEHITIAVTVMADTKLGIGVPFPVTITFTNTSDGKNIDVMQQEVHGKWFAGGTRKKIDSALEVVLAGFPEQFRAFAEQNAKETINDIHIEGGLLVIDQASPETAYAPKPIQEHPGVEARKNLEERKAKLENDYAAINTYISLMTARKAEAQEKQGKAKPPAEKAAGPERAAIARGTKLEYHDSGEYAGTYYIDEIPDGNKKNKYIIAREGGPTFKLTEEQLAQALASGKVSLAPETAEHVQAVAAAEGLSAPELHALRNEIESKIWGVETVPDLRKIISNEAEVSFTDPEAWEKVKAVLGLLEKRKIVGITKIWERDANSGDANLARAGRASLEALAEALQIEIGKKEKFAATKRNKNTEEPEGGKTMEAKTAADSAQDVREEAAEAEMPETKKADEPAEIIPEEPSAPEEPAPAIEEKKEESIEAEQKIPEAKPEETPEALEEDEPSIEYIDMAVAKEEFGDEIKKGMEKFVKDREKFYKDAKTEFQPIVLDSEGGVKIAPSDSGIEFTIDINVTERDGEKRKLTIVTSLVNDGDTIKFGNITYDGSYLLRNNLISYGPGIENNIRDVIKSFKKSLEKKNGEKIAKMRIQNGMIVVSAEKK